MIVSTLIDGKEAAEFDSEITDKFEMQLGSIQATRNERMQVAVRNSNGDIYRAIGVTGMNDFLAIVEHLAEIGLVDELENQNNSRHGYDAIFSA